MKKKKSYMINVKIPNGVTVRDIEVYIREAIQTWKGQLNPDSDIFQMKDTDFTVRGI